MNKNLLPKDLEIISNSLKDDKALNLKIINVSNKTSLTDYIIITTGTSKRHILTMAKNLREKIKKKLKYSPTLEGVEKAEWVLIDANSAIINIFKSETREFYDLEKIWSN